MPRKDRKAYNEYMKDYRQRKKMEIEALKKKLKEFEEVEKK